MNVQEKQWLYDILVGLALGDRYPIGAQDFEPKQSSESWEEAIHRLAYDLGYRAVTANLSEVKTFTLKRRDG
jgi:hypothetical protein